MPQLVSSEDSSLFFRLLISHLLAEFMFQPSTWVKHKRQKKQHSRYLYWHSLIAGVLAYIFAGFWLTGLWIILFVTVTHGVIDYFKLKSSSPKLLLVLLADQAAHLAILAITWLGLSGNFKAIYKLPQHALNDFRFVAVLAGYLICTTPVGAIIGIATAKWQRQLSDPLSPSGSLDDAGKWIGIAERLIIFSFVLLSQYEAIGFLIAAKSILRFREGEKATKQSEYVLIGTLLSYGLAILIGLLINLVIE